MGLPWQQFKKVQDAMQEHNKSLVQYAGKAVFEFCTIELEARSWEGALENAKAGPVRHSISNATADLSGVVLTKMENVYSACNV